mmetsp:Transcript_86968/g.246557  ORF Transcript_86968/g.246557 Transcript_86968/m.246557 type:complete len:321 (+) Transcript_86968:63-1025(+)
MPKYLGAPCRPPNATGGKSRSPAFRRSYRRTTFDPGEGGGAGGGRAATARRGQGAGPTAASPGGVHAPCAALSLEQGDAAIEPPRFGELQGCLPDVIWQALVCPHGEELLHRLRVAVVGGRVQGGSLRVGGRVVHVLAKPPGLPEVLREGLEGLVLALARELVEGGAVAELVPPLDVRALAHEEVDDLRAGRVEQRGLAEGVLHVDARAFAVQLLRHLVDPADGGQVVHQVPGGHGPVLDLESQVAVVLLLRDILGLLRLLPLRRPFPVSSSLLLGFLLSFLSLIAAARINAVHPPLPLREFEVGAHLLHECLHLRILIQ